MYLLLTTSYKKYMEYEVSKTKEQKLLCSLEFLTDEKLLTQNEKKAIKKIVFKECFLINATPNFEIDEQECIYGG